MAKRRKTARQQTPSRQPTVQRCPLCERSCPKEMMQKHHLQTRKVDRFDTELICADCHRLIHAYFGNKHLAAELCSVAALQAHEAFAKALAFVRKQAPGSRVRVRDSRSKTR